MSSSALQIAANRANAKRSTGPRTSHGRQIVAQNALKHGLFARQPVLDHEDPDAYAALVEDLVTDLRPVGLLETALVDRIALTLWRQRRLMQAETAELARQTEKASVARQVSYALSDFLEPDRVKEGDLEPPVPEQLAWCLQALAEFETLDPAQWGSDGTRLQTGAPTLYADLLDNAKEEGQSLSQYLSGWGGLAPYLRHIESWCRSTVQAAEQRPHLLALAAQIRDERSLLLGERLDRLAKYQTTLDNDLIKTLKTLREAQQWRLTALEPAPETDGFVLESGLTLNAAEHL